MSDKPIGIFCPACDRTGHESLMIKDTSTKAEGQVVRCLLNNHRFEYARLLALKPRMVKLALNEKQPGNTIVMQVWVYPEVQEALRQRYPQNLQTTLCALMTALADPDTVMIEGEHARALRDAGVTRGREIAGLGTVIQQLEQQVAEAAIREKALAPLMQMMSQAAAASGGGVAAVSGGLPEQESPAARASSPAATRQPTGDPVMDAMLETMEEPTVHGLPKPVPSGR